MIIQNAESVLLQPLDRDYKSKGIKRKEHLEVKTDGISHALCAGGQTMVFITYRRANEQDNPNRKYKKGNTKV